MDFYGKSTDNRKKVVRSFFVENLLSTILYLVKNYVKSVVVELCAEQLITLIIEKVNENNTWHQIECN